MAPTEKNMDCDELFRLTIDGLGRLDDVTRARCEEHASSCEECRSHLEGLDAWDDAAQNPGKYKGTPPEIRDQIAKLADDHAARAEKPRGGPRLHHFLFIGAAAGVAAFGAYEATTAGLQRPGFTPSPLPAPAPATPTADELTTPAQWMAEARRQLGMGRKQGAKPWLEKVVNARSAAPELVAEAQRELDKIK